MYVFCNPNPKGKITDDCVIRAISIAEGKSWDDIYIELMVNGYIDKDMANANYLWGKYLVDKGYKPNILFNLCYGCYTLRDFCKDHKKGTHVVGTGTHAVCVINGDYYDTWDSGDVAPVYYFSMED